MVAGSIELAAAYISLLPSTERIAPAISKEVAKAEGDVARSGKKAGAAYSAGLGGAVGGAAKRVFAPLAAAAASISSSNPAGYRHWTGRPIAGRPIWLTPHTASR